MDIGSSESIPIDYHGNRIVKNKNIDSEAYRELRTQHAADAMREVIAGNVSGQGQPQFDVEFFGCNHD